MCSRSAAEHCSDDGPHTGGGHFALAVDIELGGALGTADALGEIERWFIGP
jgi:hypothetical protein